MIARRHALRLLGGAFGLAVMPLAAQTRRLPLVVLVLGTAPANAIIGAIPKAAFVRSFVEGLAEAGWVDGSNVMIERRSAEGDPERARAILAEVVARAPDVIAIGGERWLVDAARGATRTIPIVANLVDDPVASGLVASLARPGGNLTGITEATGPEFDGKRLQLLREMAPAAYRIAFIASSRRLDQFQAVPIPPGVSILPARLDTLAGWRPRSPRSQTARRKGLWFPMTARPILACRASPPSPRPSACRQSMPPATASMPAG